MCNNVITFPDNDDFLITELSVMYKIIIINYKQVVENSNRKRKLFTQYIMRYYYNQPVPILILICNILIYNTIMYIRSIRNLSPRSVFFN